MCESPQVAQSLSVICHHNPISASFASISSIDFLPIFLILEIFSFVKPISFKCVVVGLGSACSSKKAGNRILENVGVDKDDIISSVRVSFNAYQSIDEIEKAANIILEVYQNIRARVS